ncbi:NAD(P)-binding protein [Rickenella mellea]|uniref:NAD(P)-binding protein n=1 Tax=Rickenella mellea TaxID=50990 RepID=A0A4Y7QF89_9AGAM|nr:NAD(P)-binding protein [Rickenella mellea]
MKIAVTGCNGRVGKRVVHCALERGYDVVGIDCAGESEQTQNPKYKYAKIDLKDYDATLEAFRGCDGIVHLAAYPGPGDYVVETHNANVVISWNVLRAAAELGITRIAQASTVNVVTMVFSQGPKFHYFPIDEEHPLEPDEPYGLSKVIAELQADTIVRRYPSTRIASLRIHYSIPDRESYAFDDPTRSKNDLWAYVQEDSAADAFLLALAENDEKWSGHERFFIAAPDTRYNGDLAEACRTQWPDVPIKPGKEITAQGTVFDCTKAEQLLGWKHA